MEKESPAFQTFSADCDGPYYKQLYDEAVLQLIHTIQWASLKEFQVTSIELFFTGGPYRGARVDASEVQGKPGFANISPLKRLIRYDSEAVELAETRRDQKAIFSCDERMKEEPQ